MIPRILLAIAFALSSLLATGAVAQTEYVLDGSSIDYVFYQVSPPYTNTFYDYQLTIGGVPYTVSGYLHFTQGNPAATNGSVTFTTGSTSVSETLTNINFSPFTFLNSTATADFAGQFNGSLTFNIKNICFRRCYAVLTEVNNVHSNFTID